MRLPDRVKVAAFDIAIEDWHPHTANANQRFGEFSALEQKIRIDTSVCRYKVVDTLIHEINHAIYWAYGMDDKDEEERIVGTFATAWTQVYRDNPAVLRYIAGMFGDAT